MFFIYVGITHFKELILVNFKLVSSAQEAFSHKLDLSRLSGLCTSVRHGSSNFLLIPIATYHNIINMAKFKLN